MKYRDNVKADWKKCISSGRMMQISSDTDHEEINYTIYFGIDSFGVFMHWEFPDTDKYDNVKPRFDGFVLKRNSNYYISFAEIDRMGYSLDSVIQLLYDNFKDGLYYSLYIY